MCSEGKKWDPVFVLINGDLFFLSWMDNYDGVSVLTGYCYEYAIHYM